MRVEIVRDVTVLARPRLERLQLALGLAHVAVEVVEVAQLARFGAGVGVRGVEALVVLDKDENAMLPGFPEEMEMVLQELCCGLCEEDVDLALDGVERDLVVRGVRGEDCDCGAWFQGVDGGLVRLWIYLVICGEGLERDIEPVVHS